MIAHDEVTRDLLVKLYRRQYEYKNKSKNKGGDL